MPVGTQGQRSSRLLRPADAANEQVEIFLVVLRQIFRCGRVGAARPVRRYARQPERAPRLQDQDDLPWLLSRKCRLVGGFAPACSHHIKGIKAQHSPFSAMIWRAILQAVGRQDGEGAMSVGFRHACACMIAVGSFLLGGTFEVRSAGDDARLCAKEYGYTAIEACSRAIKSGRYKGRDLARQYLYRGVERGLKQEYDLALADYGEAAKVDKKYADALQSLRHLQSQEGLRCRGSRLQPGD